MRLLGLDLETTGFDTANDRVTEIGIAVWDVETKRPLVSLGLFLHDEEMEKKFTPEVKEMMERICGITPELLREFGTDAKKNFEWLASFVEKHKIEYIVAHNGENFDRPLLLSELNRHSVAADTLRSLAWIDTRTDIPFASEPDSRKLKHLAVDHGFINPFAHRAAFDVLSMLRILSNYEIQTVLEYQRIPFITVRAMVSFENKELAKAQRFSWEKLGDKTFPKMWVKRIKIDKLDEEKKNCKGFEIARIE